MKQAQHVPRLSDLAYEGILQALFDARVPMGVRISQADLVAVTKVPVGPVRDALKVLEADGLVVVHPRSGIEVIQRTTELVRSTTQFRTIIERAAARRFAVTATEDELAELRALHQSFIERLKAMDPRTNTYGLMQDLERRFHLALISSLDNELIDASYRRLQLMGRVIRGRAVFFPQVALVSVEEHLKVLNACDARDADAAEEMIAAHLSSAMSRSLGVSPV